MLVYAHVTLLLTEESYEPEEVDLDRLPDDLLLETPPCQSALHVFASVGGLALLAEHLPLLYPEITRQATVGEAEHNSAGDMIGSDWVTVEPSDDYYEVGGRTCPWELTALRCTRLITI